ncbi:ATP-grasp domain-containing protein [Domibacillus sp. DTU_2020_1001157_1_SI_ALB_TIR_016]|uniref:ATP-grasp domain-containing protein n=1 Tax=Domibacillus sp. DTU_2020_1001157_1_SI_ALB_TIR_016 TaxID=3077789 RepID=UPI0028EB214A|nr:ATP-grasp domain-containing protein [Domibacillus sp. DTU_2020_1001157_1_SI_ALB_TIR_016]WNS80296.1 ATP-grasp domain-containing protein [Domibacillus sp. DTU_2020_1001157_1_SI_ALB_TIR_016]
MMILNEQILSPLLKQTLEHLQIPVLKEADPVNCMAFFDSLTKEQRLLTNSESGLSLLDTYCPDSNENQWSKLFKNKGQLRALLSQMYPDYFYQVVTADNLLSLPVEKIPFPVVLKPTFGYSSVGVYKVKRKEEWEKAIHQFEADVLLSEEIYDPSVVNQKTLLIEKWIQGEEYAVDGYYDEQGNPVVLSVFKRLFKDEYDTSDRIYYTSKQVIQEIYEQAYSFMAELQKLVPLQNYPIHFEIRKQGEIVIPIEINPLRFAGAGTTDLGYYAYGHNIYEQYFTQQKPDWKQIIEDMDDSIYSFCCAEIPLALSRGLVKAVDHEAFQKEFEHILEYRPIQAAHDRTFAIVFFKSDNLDENHYILQLDLEPFIDMQELKNREMEQVL